MNVTKAKYREKLLLKRKITMTIVFALLLIISFTTLFPVYFMLVTSFKGPEDYIVNKLSLPNPWVLDNFKYVFSKSPMLNLLKNNCIVVGLGLPLYILVCSAAAFAFAKTHFPFRLTIFLIVLSLMILPQMVLGIQLYKVVAAMGLLNKLSGLILVYVAYFAPFGTYLATSYYRGIPDEILQASRIDGASLWQTFIWIILPLGKPMIAILAVIGFLSMWNELTFSLLILQDAQKRTLMLGIAMLQGQYGIPVPQLSAALLVSSIPTLSVFLIFQQYVVKGFTEGAIKG